ncbi:uncharacterized protein VICG_01128 [Vittaforma corneae ATCC 50505]|uniref:Uncharacterized protein n=1 Tax=Vittaforma corneae (strain ATCC 50505) TaxID=993615 RepID=L2GLQ5_VITCO|nr:uncharacterized protein VICG_01128 [Vittaforma corneae ATCC 50505]ELA41776.1 hypothetical protein VICG_01128 [Vittaforma corneae ATCC 50505]
MFERCVIRFMADKSKKLRDEVLCLLVKHQFPGFSGDFPQLLISDAMKTGGAFIILYVEEFKRFFEVHSGLFGKNGQEESYFKALFYAFSNFDDFWIGISNTVSVADLGLKNTLKAAIETNYPEKLSLLR